MFHSPNVRRLIVWALRVLIVAAVIAGVGRTFLNATARLDAHDWQLQPLWLAASAAFYLLGLLPMAWFWRRTLAALGQQVPQRHALAAYFLGHLGKYVPGKALVVVLRVGAIRRWLGSTWLAVVSTMLETLLMMAVGAFLAAALAIVTLPLSRELTALAAAMAVAAVLPTLPPVARWIARAGLLRFRSTAHMPTSDIEPTTAVHQVIAPVTWRLWATGWLAALICWTLLGLSLWATLRAIGVDSLLPIADLPYLIGTVSLAVVAGFLSLLPGGVIVRDALLLQLLSPACGEANALFAALLLRVVWLVSELAICGILYSGVVRSKTR
jgi:hypothetical protein